MKLVFVISCYRLVPFVRLGIMQLRKLAPEHDIFVSDDPSPQSGDIESICKEFGLLYKGARQRRGHFGGDFQSFVNGLSYARANGCDVMVKVSQRFIFRKVEAIQVFVNAFSNPNIMAVTPGKPEVKGGNRMAAGFGAFGTLSDIVGIRASAMSPEQILDLYRARLLREKVPWASFIECLVDELHSNVFPGRTMKLQELTNPTADPIYLRRYQAQESDYQTLATSHGFNGMFPLGEWGQLEGNAYICKPVVV